MFSTYPLLYKPLDRIWICFGGALKVTYSTEYIVVLGNIDRSWYFSTKLVKYFDQNRVNIINIEIRSYF